MKCFKLAWHRHIKPFRKLTKRTAKVGFKQMLINQDSIHIEPTSLGFYNFASLQKQKKNRNCNLYNLKTRKKEEIRNKVTVESNIYVVY